MEAFRLAVASMREALVLLEDLDDKPVAAEVSLDGHLTLLGESFAPGAVASVADIASSLHEIAANADSLHAEIAESLDSLDELSDSETVFDETSDLVELLLKLGEDGDDAVDRLQGGRTLLIKGFDGLIADVQGDHVEQTSEAFENALQEVSDKLTQEIDGALDALAGQVTEQLVGLLTESMHVGDGLDDLWESLLKSAAAEVRNELVSELKEAARNAIASGTEALLADIAEALATMTIGSHITAAMTPVLPYLVAAKKAAEFLNALKAIF